MHENRGRFYFLDVLRGSAAWLVVWDHLFAAWPERHGLTPRIVKLVQEYVNQPLGIIQDFGWLGVALFFLISGFVITHVSLRETAWEFIIKRAFRILPILVVAMGFSLLIDQGLRDRASLAAIITNALLINYWIDPQVVLVGVAWTLAIEVAFYAVVLFTFPLKTMPTVRVSCTLVAVAGIVFFARAFGPSFFLFAATIAYLPYLIVGQLLYFVLHDRTISVSRSLFLFAATYAVMLFGLHSIHTQFLPIQNSYLVSFLIAVAVFLLAFGVGDQLRPNRLVKLLSDTSYSLYLFHGTVGGFVLDQATPLVGFPLALGIAVVSVVASVLLVHHTVEKPMLGLGRRLALSKVTLPTQKMRARLRKCADWITTARH